MFHCKVLIVDSQLVSVGSTNFDNRSFRLNDEANLNVYEPGFRCGRSTGLRAATCSNPAGSPTSDWLAGRGASEADHGSRRYRRKFPP